MDLLRRSSKMTKESGFSESVIKIILKELVKTISQIHAQDEIIKNLKTSNIFPTLSGEIKLLDFSFGKKFTESIDRSKTFLSGTPVYLAPEIITERLYSRKSDIWALGIIAVELFEGTSPFKEPQSPANIFEIVNMQAPRPTKKCSKEFEIFIEMCLQKDPNKRMEAESLLKSKFILDSGDKNILADFVYFIHEKFRTHKSISQDYAKAILDYDKQKDLYRESGKLSELNSCVRIPRKFHNMIIDDSEDDNDNLEDCGGLQKKVMRKISLLDSQRPDLVSTILKEIYQKYNKEFE